MSEHLLELTSLFFSALLAATILPFQSEFVLAALSVKTEISKLVLVLVATSGNVLGAMINWWLGKYLLHFKNRRWFPIREKDLDKATGIYQKYGVWTLLLAWMPFIGDPLTMVAGIFRTKLWLFVVLVTIGKAARYIAIVWLF